MLNITLGHSAAEPIELKVARQIRGSRTASITDDSSIREALDAGAINEIEGATLREYRRLVSEVINVDEFSVASAAAPSHVSVQES